MDHIKLTARQQQILELIQTAIHNTGAPPTRAEIATELGFKSPNAAEEHLQALARKGVIQLVSGTSRGIRLKAAPEPVLGGSSFKQFTLPGLGQLLWWVVSPPVRPSWRKNTSNKPTKSRRPCLCSNPTTC